MQSAKHASVATRSLPCGHGHGRSSASKRLRSHTYDCLSLPRSRLRCRRVARTSVPHMSGNSLHSRPPSRASRQQRSLTQRPRALCSRSRLLALNQQRAVRGGVAAKTLARDHGAGRARLRAQRTPCLFDAASAQFSAWSIQGMLVLQADLIPTAPALTPNRCAAVRARAVAHALPTVSGGTHKRMAVVHGQQAVRSGPSQRERAFLSGSARLMESSESDARS